MELASVLQLGFVAAAGLYLVAVVVLRQRRIDRMRLNQERDEIDRMQENQERAEEVRRAKVMASSTRWNKGCRANDKARSLFQQRRKLLRSVEDTSPTLHAALNRKSGSLTMADVSSAMRDPDMGRQLSRDVAQETESRIKLLSDFWPDQYWQEQLEPVLAAVRSFPKHYPILDDEMSWFDWKSAFAVIVHEMATDSLEMHRAALDEKLLAVSAPVMPSKPRARL